MEKQTDKPVEYEEPRIEDHGDLTELTAATTNGRYFDGNFTAGGLIGPHQQTSP